MKMRSRRSPFGRRPPTRTAKRRILIICEGRKTEAEYFRNIRSVFRNSLIEIELDRGGGVPKSLVERAVARKREAEHLARSQRDAFLSYDEVWCVFDVDRHPNLPEAKQQATHNGISLAISNPCFELWALLHLQEHSSHAEGKTIFQLLKRRFPGYQKVLPFDQIHPGYDLAVERAKILEQRRREADDVGGNPSTGVYKLTETIRQGGKPFVPRE